MLFIIHTVVNNCAHKIRGQPKQGPFSELGLQIAGTLNRF